MTNTKQRVSEIEDAIAVGRMNAYQVFTQMRQLLVPPRIDAMVDRFLAWRLPKDFSPDAGISFKPVNHPHALTHLWPIGTNLLNADQARAMLEHVLQAPQSERVLPVATVISEGMDHRAMIERHAACPVGTKLYAAPQEPQGSVGSGNLESEGNRPRPADAAPLSASRERVPLGYMIASIESLKGDGMKSDFFKGVNDGLDRALGVLRAFEENR